MDPRDTPRWKVRDIAMKTLQDIEHGSYTLNNQVHDLTTTMEESKSHTVYYPPTDPALSSWESSPLDPNRATVVTDISVFEISTLQGARQLHTLLSGQPDARIGVLNFASAKYPGGGFLGGARAQEESLARSSTLYPSLRTPISQQFYDLHNDGRHGYYTHAMIYSPKVIFFRDDAGELQEPITVDIVTSPAVNAVPVKKRHGDTPEVEHNIEVTMKERMARILYLFEMQGNRSLVLGSFGTGAFHNSVDMVVRVWAELLTSPNARFKHSFDRVVFAVLKSDTVVKFQEAFSIGPDP